MDTDEKGSCSVKSENLVNFSNTEPAMILCSDENPDDDDDVLLVSTLDALQVYLKILLLLVSTIAI